MSGEVCDRLAEMEKESWEDYRWEKHQLRKEALGLVEELAERKSLNLPVSDFLEIKRDSILWLMRVTCLSLLDSSFEKSPQNLYQNCKYKMILKKLNLLT